MGVTPGRGRSPTRGTDTAGVKRCIPSGGVDRTLGRGHQAGNAAGTLSN